MILIITIILFAIYIGFFFTLEQTPHSISDGFYVFNNHKKGLGHVFTIWCFIITFLIIIQMINASEGRWFQFLSLFTAGGLGFVGAAPYFKEHEKTIHITSAIVCAIGGVLWMSLMGYWFIPLIPLLLVLCIRPINYIFFGEVALFISLFIVLYLV